MLGLKALRALGRVVELDYWRELYRFTTCGAQLPSTPARRAFTARAKKQLCKEIDKTRDQLIHNPAALLHRWPQSVSHRAVWTRLQLKAVDADGTPVTREVLERDWCSAGIYGVFNWDDVVSYINNQTVLFLAETRGIYNLSAKGWRTQGAKLLAVVSYESVMQPYHYRQGAQLLAPLDVSDASEEYMLERWIPFLDVSALIKAAAHTWKIPIVPLDEAKQQIVNSIKAEGFKVRTNVVDTGTYIERRVSVPKMCSTSRTTQPRRSKPTLEEDRWILVKPSQS